MFYIHGISQLHFLLNFNFYTQSLPLEEDQLLTYKFTSIPNKIGMYILGEKPGYFIT